MHGVGLPDRQSSRREQVDTPAKLIEQCGFVLEEVAGASPLGDIAGCTDMAYTVADDVKLDAFGE